VRGVPKKLATRQDLFNVCADLHHARAAIFLKGLPPEELDRLGVKGSDLKRIRADLSARKRAEDAADKEKVRIEREIAETALRIEEVKAGLEAERAALKDAQAAASKINALEAEFAALQRDYEAVRISSPARPVLIVGAEIDEQTSLSKRGRAAGEILPDKRRESNALQAELAEVQALLGLLAKKRPVQEIQGNIAAITAEIRELSAAWEEVDASRKAIQGLSKELAASVKEIRRKKEAGELKAQLDGKMEELQACKNAATDIEDRIAALGRMAEDLKKLMEHLTSLKSAGKGGLNG